MEEVIRILKDSFALESLVFVDGTCYQHFWEVACHILFPKYDPVTQEVIHLCREMCSHLIGGCWKKLQSFFSRMEFKYINEGDLDPLYSANES